MEYEIDSLGFNKFVKPVRKKSGRLSFDSPNTFCGNVSPNDFFLKESCVYIITCGTKVLKIGETSKSLAERFSCYNDRKDRINTTEGYVMQGIAKNISCCEHVRIYVKYTDNNVIMHNGEVKTINSKILEQLTIMDYMNTYKCLPILNKVVY